VRVYLRRAPRWNELARLRRRKPHFGRSLRDR
jgi:hypothetical protein